MCEVEIIMGLKKSGKTMFLNSYLEITNVEKERILILMFNEGNTKIKKDIVKGCIKVKKFKSIFEINERKFIYLLNLYNPHRVFIEGEYIEAKHIFNLMKSNYLKGRLIITSRINIINTNFINLLSNYSADNINSNIVVINNYEKLQIYYEYIEEIKEKNKNCFLFCIESFHELYSKLKNYKLIKTKFHRCFFRYLKEYLL